MKYVSKRRNRWLRYIAMIIAIIWAGFWTFFGIASGISEGLSPLGVICHSIFPGLIFLISAIIAWRWRFIGGIVLIVVSLFVFIVYPVRFGHFPFMTVMFVLITMALPPLIAGLLVIVSYRKSETIKSENSI